MDLCGLVCYTRITMTKICRTCQREYTPSSRHLDCPICRAKDRHDTCPGCGYKKLKDSTLCNDCRLAQRGEESISWRGGSCYTKSGYVIRYCKDHPRVIHSKSKYIYDHILVMENAIGRHLTNKETVHHKNGIRDDNRIENLELWASNHPSGSRVSDLLKWAHEIIELYGDVAMG